jgi:hypothetical protein
MTFEDWYDCYPFKDNNISSNHRDILKDAWNAAINAALEQLHHGVYYYDNGGPPDECYDYTNPREDVKDLLTSK